jgi:hypothetical protein
MLDTMLRTAAVEPNAELLARCEHALELLLTHRGNPAAEIEQVLAEDPQCVLGHCLRAAIIVRADAIAARPTLATSVAAIEAACPDSNDPARRHATAARAWLEGDSALKTASIVVPKGWRGARSPSIPDMRVPFTLSYT